MTSYRSDDAVAVHVGFDGGGVAHIGFRQRATVDHGEERRSSARTLAAGVDHARFLQHREEPGAFDGLAGGGGRAGRAARRATLACFVGGLDRLGRGAHHGEDRAFDRPQHRLVRGVGRAAEPATRSAPDASSWSEKVSASLRRICDRMTPELPRAPMSDPCETAWQISAIPSAESSSPTTD